MFLRGSAVIASLFSLVLLSGCNAAFQPRGPVSGPEIHGSVFGGQQPIVGAQLYLYAAGTATLGVAGYGSGATSLLDAPGYVVTLAGGNFSITSDYTCPSASTPVYLVAVGGNTGSGPNTSAILMSALGPCGNLSASSFVQVNEVTTIGAVWALQQFMTPGTVNVGSSSTNVTGLQNAFASAANLVSVPTGNALGLTPGGNGIVPGTTINTLANIMASCVNSTTGSQACQSLFTDATPPSGTAPVDTLTAMLDIALNPGNNVGALYTLGNPTPPFQPALTSAPSDFTLSIQYSGGGLQIPYAAAIDANGNVWVTNNGAYSTGALSEFSPAGVSQFGSTGLTIANLSYPQSLAIDPSGNVWTETNQYSSAGMFEVSNSGSLLSGTSGYSWGQNFGAVDIAIDGSGNVFAAGDNSAGTALGKMSSTGTVDFFNSLYTTSYGASVSAPGSVAIDGTGTVWLDTSPPPNSSTGYLQRFTSAGVAIGAPFSGGGLGEYPQQIAFDSAGDAWVANGSATVSKFSSAGTPISTAAGYATASSTSNLAIDGASTVWAANLHSISHLAANGASLSPFAGYSNPVYQTSSDADTFCLAIDPSGNVWTCVFADYYTSTNPGSWMVEYIGVAAPVLTPQSMQLKSSEIGVRP